MKFQMQDSSQAFAVSVFETLKAELPGLTFALLLPAEKCELCLTEQATINHLCVDCDHYIRTDADDLMWEWQEEDSAILCPACLENIDFHDDSLCDFMKNEMDKQAWRDEQMSLLLAECRGKS